MGPGERDYLDDSGKDREYHGLKFQGPKLLVAWQRRLCFWYCWFVCLSVDNITQKVMKKKWIGLKHYGGVLGSTMKNLLSFGGDVGILR